ncbi:MAG: hypothetical protein M3Q16_02935 [Pseudomonadota bacterium]|nr:hypothetical protein [Pseudomonadota bacterium]
MKNLSAALSVIALLPEPLAANATLIDPIPYTSFASSPFSRSLFGYFQPEDFEVGLLNASGNSTSLGSLFQPASVNHTLDAEDDSINDSGTASHTWFFNGVSSLTFIFSKALLGALPTHAGLVWTDVGLTNVREGFDSILFEAFDAADNLLGIVGPSTLGNGLFAGQTSEDRFFGVTSSSGIGSVRISLLSSTEQEFAQSSTVAEPATLALLVAGRAGTGFIRKRFHS